ncbi:DNA primase [Leptospira ilyithenensis]|uniref:DNA primase n=1 Tax=Leptospira ilyithenensis TaxID=2484901 RepID=A0A4V3JWV0_9LEPT|nr:DNA primase [Leptospira ilyithenensis]TGN08168.1 DNA primase [Leptospira ilyithenensis]
MNSYQNFKERVRREVSIDSYINRFVPLRRAGRNLTGLCPFHNEKTPSFSVNAESGFYHCFGCKASGDIFRFVMDYQKVDFIKALEILADYSGIPLQEKTQSEEEEDRKKEALYQISQRAKEYFQKNFATTAGEVALKYLQERGLYEEDIKVFGIGFALPGFANIIKDLFRTESEIKLGESLGLLKRQDKNRDPYDFFRSRVMFPVIDSKGRVVAFSGRIVGQSEEAKYINSPNSLIYDKSRIFYNLNLAQDSIRKHREAVVVEGVFDAIGLFRKGIESVVAPLGTGFTEGHARILKNMSDRVILMMDSDSAGVKGAFRAVNLLSKEGIEVKVASVPEGKDPYDYSLNHNKQEIRSILENSSSASQFMIAQILSGTSSISQPEAKQASIKRLLDFVKSMEKETDKQVYLQEGAKQLGLSFSALFRDFEGTVQKSSPPPGTDNKRASKGPIATKKANSAQLCERKMIAKLIQNQELFSFADDVLQLEFLDEASSFLWDYLYTKFLQNEPISPAEILSKEDIPKEYLGLVAEQFSSEEANAGNGDSIFKELLWQHKAHQYDFAMNDITKRMGDSSLSLEEKRDLLTELSFLKNERDKIWEYLRKLQPQEV